MKGKRGGEKKQFRIYTKYITIFYAVGMFYQFSHNVTLSGCAIGFRYR